MEKVTCKLSEKGCWADGRCHYIGNCENKITTTADRTFDFLSTYIRMTKPKDNGECGISCSKCPLSWKNNGSEQLLTCAMFIRRYPERAVELLRKWEEEHRE